MSSRSPAPSRETSASPAPATPGLRSSSASSRWIRRLVAALLVISALLTVSYTGLSIFIATLVVAGSPQSMTQTPAAFGLDFRRVNFKSREDHVLLKGWFIPGVLPDGRLTTARTIIVVHGHNTNRADPDVGILDLSAAFARQGFAVLAFDMRGTGESAPAATSLGYFEPRDVLGALDFLRSGAEPYPELGRPLSIGGWGVSMGAAVLLLAAAQEPALQAIVSDCAFANVVPRLERDIPRRGNLPPFMTPGALLAARVLYGIDFYHVRPIDVVATIAPRPLFFIHGAADKDTPPSDMAALVGAARTASNAQVQSWLVPGAVHAKSYKVAGSLYERRVLEFFTTWLGTPM